MTSIELKSAKDSNIAIAGFVSSSVNLLNTIIGAGILAIPYAVSLTGLFPSIFLLIFSAFVSALGLYFLAASAAKTKRGNASFNTMTRMTYPSCAVLFDLSIIIQGLGVGAGYLILIGDVMPQVFRFFFPNQSDKFVLFSRHFWITMFMLVITPFAFLRRLDSLRHISYICMACIGYVILLIMINFFRYNIHHISSTAYMFKGKGVAGFFRLFLSTPSPSRAKPTCSRSLTKYVTIVIKRYCLL